MDKLTAMSVFTRVVERGSFTAAAEELRLSRAMTSKHVQDLEAHLGVGLLNRTTRRVSLTEEGRLYHALCVQILADITEAEQSVAERQAEPQGTLRLNTAVSFGTHHIAPAIVDFTTLHPRVRVDMTLVDRVVDLVDEGYDLAIRIGTLASSSLIARRLAPCRLVVCASPEYLARSGRPAHPADLADHNCLGYTYGALTDTWRFIGPGGEVAVPISGNLQINNGDALRSAALRGHGVVLLPTFIIGPDLKAGTLERVLPDYAPPDMGIHAVYPPGRHLPAKVRSFIDFLAQRFGDHPEWDAWREM
ncbi:MAG: LysR family transcriptional regulator [Rhodospirillaceae bacterium BRH_c57]|nr:MAG: LysR family transcriptional regulator [Rhodospirillaceae bacterium BRH_c57]